VVLKMTWELRGVSGRLWLMGEVFWYSENFH
jgi:hypothetical protein